MSKPLRVVWYKTTDLRLHDHAPLTQAHAQGGEVQHIVVLDPSLGFGPNSTLSRNAGVARLGCLRAQFLIESIQDLEKRLARIGQILLVYVAVRTLDVFRQLIDHRPITAVYSHGPEWCTEEQTIEKQVHDLLRRHSIPLYLTSGWTLHHPGDVKGFRVSDRYKDFLRRVSRKKRSTCACKPLEEPTTWADAAAPPSFATRVKAIPPFNVSRLRVKDLVHIQVMSDKQMPIGSQSKKGGETAALKAMKSYIWEDDRLRNYVGSSDSMSPGKHNALNSTTGLSPYLAFGCLSPRRLYSEVLQYERKRRRNRSTYWVFHELVFRDYFVFLCWEWKSSLFHRNGPGQRSSLHDWRSMDDPASLRLFQLWKEGRTGYPLVDAGMRQLSATGHMPHLVRQLTAGFLVRDLRLDWRWGAEWFEQCLLDYTPDANYGNWTYRILPLAQLMPLANQHLSSLEILSWPVVHDPQLEYTLRWLPELRAIAEQFSKDKIYVREPWRLYPHYGKDQKISVVPKKDSPLWIMSVNRSNWPEYQQMMTGTAWTLGWDKSRIGTNISSACSYAYPIVAPLELEIMYDQIPLDHGWGDGPLVDHHKDRNQSRVETKSRDKQMGGDSPIFRNVNFPPDLQAVYENAKKEGKDINTNACIRNAGSSLGECLMALGLTRRHCGSYHLTGFCNRKGCPYKHDMIDGPRILPETARRVARILEKGFEISERNMHKNRPNETD